MTFPPTASSHPRHDEARRRFLRLAGAAALGLIVPFGAGCGSRRDVSRWTMLHVNPRDHQADTHLLEFPSGRFVLIDVADPGDQTGIVVPELKRRGVREVALIVISHFHTDHYGRLVELIESGVRVERVALNVPAKAAADRERPWGCDWDDVQRVLAVLRERNVPYFTPQAGEVIFSETLPGGGEVKLEVLCAYDGENTPIGPTDVNDTSIVVRLQHGNTRALFTGDLNFALGRHLVASGADLRADVLKAPHHGTESTVPDEFFEAVGAKAVLVPSPKNLWLSPRSKRVREFYRERGVPAYVNGIHGHVTVELKSDSFRVIPQRPH